MIKYTKAEELLRQVWELMGGGFIPVNKEQEDLLVAVNKYLNRKQTPRSRKKANAE